MPLQINNRNKLRYLVDDNNCWVWQLTSYKVKGGTRYGRYKETARGKHYTAHRYFYEKLVGKIPRGLHLHHKCHNSLCVNPDHLEPILPGEHTRLHNDERHKNRKKS